MKRLTWVLALLLVPAAVRPAVAEEVAYYVGHHEKFVNIAFESEADLETIVGTTHQASGEIKADAAAETGSVRLSVPVASLKTGVDLRDEHLRSAMWLEAEKFPDLSFSSKSVRKAEGGGIEVTGDFTLHGVTKEMTVLVEFKEIPEEAAKKANFPAGKWMRFSTEFKISLSDFGVKVPDVAVGKVNDTWTVKMTIFAGTAKPEGKK
ncbi:MAG: YceI family protein [Planctomycetes bacterium]|nr:YceI family protein [Planctomycetota bacterium]